MKKFLNIVLFVITSVVFCGCSSDEPFKTFDDHSSSSETHHKAEPKTEVFFQSNPSSMDLMEEFTNNSHSATRASNGSNSEFGFNIPDDGKYTVYYFIRIDNQIPGYDGSDYKSEDYFPRTKSGGSVISTLNRGYVLADAPWDSNSKFSKYIFDTSGKAVQDIIVKEPSIEDLLKANQGVGDDFTGFIENQDKLHYLWYICKKQDKDHSWHIDGILTSKDKTDVSQTSFADDINTRYPKETFLNHGEYKDVEIDIHQQEHKDWGEIKTSIHIKDITDVRIELPIELNYICESDDFALRRTFGYETNFSIIGSDRNVKEILSVDVDHKQDKTVISVYGVTQEIIDRYGGILTIEVHSYFKNLSDDDLWNRLKMPSVDLSNRNIGHKGQIHYKNEPKTSDRYITLPRHQ